MIDASIPLQVKPPQSPMDQYGRVLAIQNALGQQQVQQQQIQSGQIQLQQQQQDQQDQQVFRQVLQETNGDYEKAAPLLAGKVSPKLQMSLQEGILKHQKELADKTKVDLENESKKDEYIANGLNAISAAPPEQQGNAYGQFRVSAIQKGMAKAEDIPEQFDPHWVLLHKFLSTPVNQQMNAALTAKSRETAAKTGQDKLQIEKDEKFLNAASGAQSQQQLDQMVSQAKRDGVTVGAISRVPAMFSPQSMQQFGRTLQSAEQRVQSDQAAANATRTGEHEKVTERQAEDRLKIEKAAHELQANKFAMEFGGDAVKGWAKSLADNPDAVASVPPALRSAVQKQFTADTGLPYPKALSGSAVDQERAARNTLDKIPRIQELLADPEISSRIGPIMGRLGNAEQKLGSAVGLSAAGEQKAQELRTIMRYMVFGEGKAVLGGRMPQQLVKELEQSSPSVKMSPDTLQGAMTGVIDAAHDALDNADKQRFGGKMRTREQRGIAPPVAMSNAAPKIGTIEDGHRFKGGDPSKPENWEKVR